MLPAECSSISWPDLSSLKHLTLQIDESIPWELDSLLPSLSLRSLTFGANSNDPTLSLEDCEAIARHVATTTSLKELSFEFFGYCLDMSEEGMERVFSAMLDNISLSLHTFSVGGVTNMHDEAAKMLSNFILRNPLMISLDLPGVALTARGALHVAKALKQMHVPVVRYFDFTVNKYDVTDFVELLQGDYSQFVDINNALENLEFYGIGDDGVKEMVELLRYDSLINKLH